MKNLFENEELNYEDEPQPASDVSDFVNNGIPDVQLDFDEFSIEDQKPFVLEDVGPIEEKDNEDENSSVSLFNKEFGTNYTSKKEIEDLLKSNRPEKKDEKNIDEEFEKLEENYEHNKSVYNYLEGLQNKSDRDVIYHNERLHAINKAKETGEQFDEEEFDMLINEKLETWENYGSIAFNAQQIREKIKAGAQDYKQKIDKVDNRKLEIENKKYEDKINVIKNELHSIFENKMFMGVAITKEDIANTYEDITNNKFAEKINNSPQLQVKLALMLRLGNEITKRATGPTASDGIKSIMDEFSPSKVQTQSLSKAKGNGVTSKVFSVDSVKGFTS